MGRTNNYKTRNPYKLVATKRHAGPHQSFKRQGRKRGGARNMVREYLDESDDYYNEEEESAMLWFEAFPGDDE